MLTIAQQSEMRTLRLIAGGQCTLEERSCGCYGNRTGEMRDV